jgi:hypothetical protein
MGGLWPLCMENEILSISFYQRRYSVQDELYPPPFETLMCHMANAVLSAIRVVARGLERRNPGSAPAASQGENLR